jgi:hypothetical protein
MYCQGSCLGKNITKYFKICYINSRCFQIFQNILRNILWQVSNFITLPQKWRVIYYPKSLWDLKSELTSLHFTDFILVKVISL